MSSDTYQLFLYVMTAIGAMVFVALYFVKAGYGIFHTSSWGISIPNKPAWILMETPAFAIMLLCWLNHGIQTGAPQSVFVLLFLLHYFQRSFIFPLLMKGRSRMPLLIVLMGAIFNTLNAWLLAEGMFYYSPVSLYPEGWDYWRQIYPWIGLLLFIAGMIINLHSDHVIRHLRKPGDTNHYLPDGGLYRYVTSANYFGELLEWTGFAVLTSLPAAWVFVWWTAANLVPRANAIYKRYCEEFGEEAVGKRKRIIPFIY